MVQWYISSSSRIWRGQRSSVGSSGWGEVVLGEAVEAVARLQVSLRFMQRVHAGSCSSHWSGGQRMFECFALVVVFGKVGEEGL